LYAYRIHSDTAAVASFFDLAFAGDYAHDGPATTTPIAGSGLAGFSKCESKAQNRHGRQELHDSYLAGEARTA